MQLAVKTRPEHTTWPRLRDVWRAADEIELFDSMWNWDHFYPLSGDRADTNFEGWAMLAAMAEATSRIRLGCQVTGMIYRHPAVLANMAATIDVIAEGRLELGVGAGWNQEECDALGLDLPPLKERFDRFDEGVQVLIALLTQERANFAGEYYTLTDAYCAPKAVQRPHPPITIGGRGPKRTLGAVARWAQQWNAIVESPADWQQLKQTLVQRCAEVDRDPAEIVCSVNVRMDTADDVGRVVEQAAAYREAGVDLMVFNLPLDCEPGVLGPLATAAAPLAE